MKFKMINLFLMGVCAVMITGTELPNPKYTRTMLKVSRSLPGETQELKVRTSEGNIATLIVKRREKSDNSQQFNATNNESNITKLNTDDKIKSVTPGSSFFPINLKQSDLINSEDENEPTKFKLETKIYENNDDNFDNWRPLDFDGKTLNTIEPTKETFVKPLVSETTKSTPITEEIKNNGLIFARNFYNREERTLENRESGRGSYTPIYQNPRPLTRTNIGANLSKNRGGKDVPPEITIRSEINVKSIQKRRPMTLDSDGVPVIHGVVKHDEPIDKIQIWRNARVINNTLVANSTDNNVEKVAETTTSTSSTPTSSSTHEENAEKERFQKFFQDVNRRFGHDFDDEPRNVYFEWDPTSSHRNTALNADVYETKNENYRSNIQKRMLRPEGHQSYPPSPIYTPESQKISPITLKTGVRAPVLQYAHPELGIQPAKILKNEKKQQQQIPDNFPDNQNSFTEQRHKKKYVLNDKNIIDSYKAKNYYPNAHFYGLKQIEPPFWIKISENLKNQFSTGVERVSQLTKPVIDPLVEATHKISKNLGLSRGQEAQEKIGTVASGSSILIPALGLVASGAALGIGAVAVGRYLDVDVLKRSNEQHNYIQSFDNQRAFSGDNEEELEIGETQIDNQRRNKRSLDDLDIFKADDNMENLIRSKRMRKINPIDFNIPSMKKKVDNQFSVFVNGNSRQFKRIKNNFDYLNNRQKRYNDDIEFRDELQNLKNSDFKEVTNLPGDWKNTLCAKKIFCMAMIQRGRDNSIFMEKKMKIFLDMIQPRTANQVAGHFHQVMEAVRRDDCSRFFCPQAQTSEFFI